MPLHTPLGSLLVCSFNYVFLNHKMFGFFYIFFSLWVLNVLSPPHTSDLLGKPSASLPSLPVFQIPSGQLVTGSSPPVSLVT